MPSPLHRRSTDRLCSYENGGFRGTLSIAVAGEEIPRLTNDRASGLAGVTGGGAGWPVVAVGAPERSAGVDGIPAETGDQAAL
jgi:hypothetical protein